MYESFTKFESIMFLLETNNEQRTTKRITNNTPTTNHHDSHHHDSRHADRSQERPRNYNRGPRCHCREDTLHTGQYSDTLFKISM